MRTLTKKECDSIRLLRSLKQFGVPIRARCYEPNPYHDITAIGDIDASARNDCSTRSMSKVLNLPYEGVFAQQLVLAKYYYVSYNHMAVIDHIMSEHGYEYQELPEDIDPILLAFMLSHPKGRYILMTIDHAVAYINGTLWDNFDPRDIESGFSMIVSKSLYGWYEKRK